MAEQLKPDDTVKQTDALEDEDLEELAGGTVPWGSGNVPIAR